MQKWLTRVALLTVIATPSFAQSFDPENSTGNVLTTPYEPITAVHRNGLRSFAKSPVSGPSRMPQFDYRQGNSKYPFGSGHSFPYPDRPYGDPDHW